MTDLSFRQANPGNEVSVKTGMARSGDEMIDRVFPARKVAAARPMEAGQARRALATGAMWELAAKASE